MSDCEQIQFYIQQQFDADLSFEDEQAVLAHIDSCHSCTRYRNQIEQVIVFAQDLPLSEEYLPAEYETLVARVADHLPKPTLSKLDVIINFFGKVLGLRSKGTSIIRPTEARSKIAFPHMERNLPQPAQGDAEVIQATSTDSRGLGKKFGVELPQTESMPAGATTLAESIRQNLSSTKAAAPPLSPPAAPTPTATTTPQSPAADTVTHTSELTPSHSILDRLATVLEGGQPAAPAGSLSPATPPLAQPSATKPAPTPPRPTTPPPSPLRPTPLRPTPLRPTTPPPAPPVAKVPAATIPTPPPTTVTPPTRPQTTAPEASKTLLKNVEDEDIDSIFTQKLGVTPAAARATVHQTAPPPGAAPPPPSTPTPPPVNITAPSPTPINTAAKITSEVRKTETKPSGLFTLDDDTMDKIFAENLGVEERTREIASNRSVPETTAAKTVVSDDEIAAGKDPAPSINVPASTAPAAAELEINAPPPVEIEGLGRLDHHAEADVQAGPSQIGAIGKFLLDRQDIQNLEKLTQSNLAETGLRILTPDAEQDLQGLLRHIRAVQGVVGSVIVGHDGLVVSTDFPNAVEADSIAVWSLGVYLNTDNAVKKMGRNSVKQFIAQTTKGHLAITDFGAGILATVTDDPSVSTLANVMRITADLANLAG